VSHGTNWTTEGTNVLSPAAPQWMRDQQLGPTVGPYNGYSPAGSTAIPQTLPATPPDPQAAMEATATSATPYANIANRAAPGLEARQRAGLANSRGRGGSNWGMGTPDNFGGRMPSAMGGGMPSWMSQIQQMLPQGMWQQNWGQAGGQPTGPGGFGGKATPGAPPSTLGASNG